MNKKVTWVFIIVFVVIVGFVIIMARQGSGPQATDVGQKIPIQNRAHISVGETHPPYNSTPATSGWHYSQSIPAGVYSEAIQEERAIHSLEHGRVIIYYNQVLSENLISELESIGESRGCPVIVAPYPDLNRDIALTAWGRLDKFNFSESPAQSGISRSDLNRINEFIDGRKHQGPEFIPCN